MAGKKECCRVRHVRQKENPAGSDIAGKTRILKD